MHKYSGCAAARSQQEELVGWVELKDKIRGLANGVAEVKCLNVLTRAFSVILGRRCLNVDSQGETDINLLHAALAMNKQ